MRCLGLDMGERRIGVALSDPDGLLAIPLSVITRRDEKADLETILHLAQQHQVGCIVVGLPRSMDGSIGREAQKVQAFINLLSEHSQLPVESWDERLSTKSAEKLMLSAGSKRSKRKEWRDALAASLILQGYLDSAQAIEP